MNASDYLKLELLDHITDPTTGVWVAPAFLYLALLKSTSTSSDTPATQAALKEILDSTGAGTDGYIRQLVQFGTVAALPGEIKSTNQVVFGPATATWPEATDAWLLDTLTPWNTGNIIGYGQLTAPKTVLNTASCIFEIGEIVLSLA